jgi:hypothetical protein
MLMSSPADKKSLRDLWKLGFGQVRPDVLIGPWALDSIRSYSLAITANILIANLPQTVLSFLYVLVNGLLTSLFLAQEWSGYAQERKALRVSSRRGQQWRTYFSIPSVSHSIPLLIMCGFLHWLCSQSICGSIPVQRRGQADRSLCNCDLLLLIFSHDGHIARRRLHFGRDFGSRFPTLGLQHAPGRYLQCSYICCVSWISARRVPQAVAMGSIARSWFPV